MRKTRLFPTLVLFGASLTGGAVAIAAGVSIGGCCGDDTSQGYAIIDMPSAQPLDMAAHDLAHYPRID